MPSGYGSLSVGVALAEILFSLGYCNFSAAVCSQRVSPMQLSGIEFAAVPCLGFQMPSTGAGGQVILSKNDSLLRASPFFSLSVRTPRGRYRGVKIRKHLFASLVACPTHHPHVYGLEGWADVFPILFRQCLLSDPSPPLAGFLRGLDPNPCPLTRLGTGVSPVSEVRVSRRHQQSSCAKPNTGITAPHETVCCQRDGLRQDATRPSRPSSTTIMARFWFLFLSGIIQPHGRDSQVRANAPSAVHLGPVQTSGPPPLFAGFCSGLDLLASPFAGLAPQPGSHTPVKHTSGPGSLVSLGLGRPESRGLPRVLQAPAFGRFANASAQSECPRLIWFCWTCTTLRSFKEPRTSSKSMC